jgi:hypothetical protein
MQQFLSLSLSLMSICARELWIESERFPFLVTLWYTIERVRERGDNLLDFAFIFVFCCYRLRLTGDYYIFSCCISIFNAITVCIKKYRFEADKKMSRILFLHLDIDTFLIKVLIKSAFRTSRHKFQLAKCKWLISSELNLLEWCRAH